MGKAAVKGPELISFTIKSLIPTMLVLLKFSLRDHLKSMKFAQSD